MAQEQRLTIVYSRVSEVAQNPDLAHQGRCPKASLAEQEACLAQMSYVADAVRYLCQELHTLLEVVVPLPAGLLGSEHRQGEIITVLDLLDELVASTTPAWQGQLAMLAKQIRLALPHSQYFFKNDKLNRAYLLMSSIEEPNLEILRLQQPDACYRSTRTPVLIYSTLAETNIGTIYN